MWGTCMAGPNGSTDNQGGPTSTGSAGPSSAGQGGSSSSSASAAAKAGSALASLEKAAAGHPAGSPDGSSPSSTPSPDAGRAGAPTASATGTTEARGAAQSDTTPEARIQTAVRNARQALESELGYVRSLGTREEVEDAIRIRRMLYANSRSFWESLGQELGLGATASREEPPKPFELPEGDLLSEDRKEQAYSVKAMRQIITDLRADIERSLRAEFQPAIDFTTSSQEQAELDAIRSESRDIAREAIATARQYPHFKEHEQAIADELAAIDPRVRSRVGSVGAMLMAYNKVLTEKVLPTLGAKTEAATIADLQRSAAAGSTTVTTTATGNATAPKLRDGNVDDLAAHMARIEQRLATAS